MILAKQKIRLGAAGPRRTASDDQQRRRCRMPAVADLSSVAHGWQVAAAATCASAAAVAVGAAVQGTAPCRSCSCRLLSARWPREGLARGLRDRRGLFRDACQRSRHCGRACLLRRVLCHHVRHVAGSAQTIRAGPPQQQALTYAWPFVDGTPPPEHAKTAFSRCGEAGACCAVTRCSRVVMRAACLLIIGKLEAGVILLDVILYDWCLHPYTAAIAKCSGRSNHGKFGSGQDSSSSLEVGANSHACAPLQPPKPTHTSQLHRHVRLPQQSLAWTLRCQSIAARITALEWVQTARLLCPAACGLQDTAQSPR